MVAAGVSPGCSCDGGDSTSTTAGPGGDGGSGAATPTGSGGGGQGGGLITGCQGTICGSGECCAQGEECVINACLPACDSNVRCGADLSVCCAAGEVCVADACVPPGAPCTDWADCPEGEFCEPTVGACLPQPPGSPACEYKPPVGPLTPTLEWSWTTSAIFPTFHQVINMPVVVDLEKDGTPDVVIVTSDNFNYTGLAYLRALNGSDGAEKWAEGAGVYQNANRVQPRTTPASADIDGDGMVEIVTGKAGGGLIAFEHDGTLKWVSTQADGVTPWTAALNSHTVAIADLEGDGTPEIVVGGVIFDATGKLRHDGGVNFGSNNGTYGAVSIIADLDGAMPQEVVGARRALRADGTLYWDNGLTDGYPAIADLDLDGAPELVVISAGTVRVQSPTTGAVLAQLQMPGTGDAGPPTIADFDADGVPEIASATGNFYTVFEYTASPPAVTLKWQTATQDQSSFRTGSSVFDFQGDGAAEVVYNDECYFRVYTGTDGSILYEEPNSSATIHEYPVVVDVDGDNNTEVVLTANDLNHLGGSPSCPYGADNARHGVFVYGDAGDNWVRTRRIWNQHAYHITNINGDGTIPSPEPASWGPQGLNNYRQSSQGAGVFNAPDLQVSLEASLAPCPTGVTLRAFVQNKGSLGVAPGVKVRFYRGTSGSGALVGEATTTTPLLPGQYEVVTVDYAVTGSDASDQVMSFFVEVDKDDQGQSDFNECLEDNNAASLDGVACESTQ